MRGKASGISKKTLALLLLSGIGAGVYFFFGPPQFTHGQVGTSEIRVELRDPSLNLLSSGGNIVVPPFIPVLGVVTASFTGVSTGAQSVDILGAFGYSFYEVGTCEYPIAGTPCTLALSDFIPGGVCVSGANACTNTNVNAGQVRKVVFRFTNTAPVPGEVRIARVDEVGVLLPVGSTIATVDTLGDVNNPAFFLSVSPGAHTARSIDVDFGLNVWVGVCMYPQGGSVCTPASFVPASCAVAGTRTCTLGISVNSSEVTNVVFMYAPPGFSPTPLPLPPSVLTCAPLVQSVLVGQPATLSLTGGVSPYLWVAIGGIPITSASAATTFTTTFAAPGSYLVGVFDSTDPLDFAKTQRAACTVNVFSPPPPLPPPGPSVTGWSWGGDNGGVFPMIGGVGWISMGN